LFIYSFWYVICGVFFVIILLSIYDHYLSPPLLLPYEQSTSTPVDPYLFGVFILHITVCIIFILVCLYYRQKYKKMLLHSTEKVETHG
jgi:heme/copper-type cytochrome/quinol oxidase subunit 3